MKDDIEKLITGPVLVKRKKVAEVEKQLPNTATLLDLSERYVESNPQWAYRTTDNMTVALRQLIGFLGDRQLSVQTADELRLALLEKYSPQTAAVRINYCCMFMNWLVANEYADSNPFRKIARIKYSQVEARKNKFTEEEYRLAKEKFKDKPEWYYILVVGYRTGMRLSDICLMTADQIDWDSRVINYVPRKSRAFGKPACVPMTNTVTSPNHDLVDVLMERMEKGEKHWSGKNFIYPDVADRILRANGHREVSCRFGQQLRRIGIKRSAHSMRRCFVTDLAHSSLNPMVACSITGQSLKTFMSYVTPDVNELRKALDKTANK